MFFAVLHFQENFYARNSNFPDGPENLLVCSELSSPAAHLDWFGCLKFIESGFAGGEIESVSASSLFERSSKTTHS